MGYKRRQWESINAKKRKKNEKQKQNKNAPKTRAKREDYLPSPKADNRFVCPVCQRMKYCYTTFEKALRACKYLPDAQRPYYCKACRAFHTTSITKEEYYERADDNYRKRTGEEPLHTRLPDLIKNPNLNLKKSRKKM